MRAKLVYEAGLAGRAKVFAESESGTLDYDGDFDADGATAAAAKALGRDPGPLVGELSRVRDYEEELYLAEKERATIFLIGQSPCCGPGSDPEIAAFFRRLPQLDEAMAWGDMNLAVLLVRRSRKLAPFRRLLGYIYAERWAIAFAAAWLNEGASEARFDELLNGGCESARMDPSFALARPRIAAASGRDYRAEAAETVLAELDRGWRLVVPVAGAQDWPCIRELSALVAEARGKARVDAILRGGDSSSVEDRLDAYLASVDVFLRPEPTNPADRSAVMVMLLLPGSSALEHAGYLPRALASVLSPALVSEDSYYRAELFRLYEGGADIRISSIRAGEEVL